MKARPEAILRPEQARYLETLLPPRDPHRRRMEEAALRDSVPIVDPEVGHLLAALAGACGARRILEIGTAIGYSALCLARGAPEARIVSIDRDPEMLRQARRFLAAAGVGERIELLEGEALEILPPLPGPFDLVFVDGDKQHYRRFLDLSLPKLRVGGLVVLDNLLYQGLVAEPQEGEEAPQAEAVAAFNGYFMIHPQLRSVVVPLGDGVGIGVKLVPLVTEMGGPF